MLKIKHERTADVVLAGYREHKTSTPEEPLIGSLLLGLYDDDGELQHIGVSASFTAAKRAELWQELQPLVCDIADHPWGRWQEFLTANPDRVPGTQSRWSAGKDLGFTALRPERVLEVKYDHMEGRRFRHTAHFKRWRTDRDPESCGYGQLDEPAGYDLTRILSTDPGGAPMSEHTTPDRPAQRRLHPRRARHLRRGAARRAGPDRRRRRAGAVAARRDRGPASSTTCCSRSRTPRPASRPPSAPSAPAT